MRNKVIATVEYTAVYLIGAVGYTAIELLWRGYSHWTMALTGGICFLAVYLCERSYGEEPLWKKCVIDCLAITLVELLVGFVVNIVLEWAVWDYSTLHFNVCGQISLLYSVLWFMLCMPLSLLCRRARHSLQKREQRA